MNVSHAIDASYQEHVNRDNASFEGEESELNQSGGVLPGVDLDPMVASLVAEEGYEWEI